MEYLRDALIGHVPISLLYRLSLFIIAEVLWADGFYGGFSAMVPLGFIGLLLLFFLGAFFYSIGYIRSLCMFWGLVLFLVLFLLLSFHVFYLLFV